MNGHRPKVLYYSILQFQPSSLKQLHECFELITLPDPDADTAMMLEKAEAVFAPLGYYWGKEKIDQAPRLRAIASNTTGIPHIDAGYAETRGIRVISLAGESDFLTMITPTAELTMGLILGVVRRIPWAFDAVLKGRWNRRPFGGKGMLSRMSLGIVGLGRLGKMAARHAVSFGMLVRYYDPSKEPHMEGLEKSETLEELVAQSDIVTVHIPHEKRNEHLFGERLFQRFKDGAYFINTSRGEIVDSLALLKALESGKLAGAALDVLDGEFEKGFGDRAEKHPLVDYARTHDNLLITPHIGGSTFDAWSETEAHTISKLIKVISGSSRS